MWTLFVDIPLMVRMISSMTRWVTSSLHALLILAAPNSDSILFTAALSAIEEEVQTSGRQESLKMNTKW